MVEEIDGMAEGAVGFTATGEVTADDYERVIVPAVEAALGRRDKVSLLYVLGDGFEGYEAAAMWDDAKVGMGHLFSWERIGVVTDRDSYRRMVQGFGFLIPAHVRVFGTADLEEAKAWVGGE
jgi:hypothetical protein